MVIIPVVVTGDQFTEDMVLDAATLEGARRCINQRRNGSSAILPDDPFWGDEEDLRERQRAALKPTELDLYQTRLLAKAKMLLDFWDANVGGSEEFPLVLQGENVEVLEQMEEYFTEVRIAVGVLSEV